MTNEIIKTERKKIKLQTLTPIHIGSGEVLKENFDYIKIKDGDCFYLTIINHKSVANILQQKDKFLFNKYISCLQSGESIKDFIKTHLKNYNIEKYIKRYIYFDEKQKDIAKDLREQMYDGFGNPYIPGSSIKGAIRTVILSYLLKEDNKFNSKPDTLFKKEHKERNKKLEYNLMHSLQVSDAYFEQGSTDALNMINLNIRNQNSFHDTKAKQLVEAITVGEESSFVMSINNVKYFPFPIESIKELFALINQHTKRILKNEIDFWENYLDEDKIVQDYSDTCKNILAKFKSIDENSCILRVGHANGWKFITGDWAMDLLHSQQERNEEIIDKARYKNQQKYENYPFPKSRRINITNDKVNLLGFVKLTIEE